ncbi:hypothetical protein GGR56DRAFT_678086 [Xylariaceae sp. FL0804]|nr:hypothetical protein GGR56DRAFT_678086 [Xylariaceae sp. FL0804]
MAATVDGDNLSTRARAHARGMLAYGQRQVDRVVSPPTRQQAYDSTSAFASERPLLSSFIAVQVLFSSLPVLFFAGFVLSAAGLALCCALGFALFWLGVALLVLLPALCVAGGLAALAWLWALAAFLAGRWARDHLLPERLMRDGGVGADAGGKNGLRDLQLRLGIRRDGEGDGDGDADAERSQSQSQSNKSKTRQVIYQKKAEPTLGIATTTDGLYARDIKADAAEVQD